MPSPAGKATSNAVRSAIIGDVRTHAALLRGINVGGRNRLAMSDLRAVISSLGHSQVATYIQSGNAVFCAADPTAAADSLADGLELALSARLGRGVPAVVVDSRRLGQVAAQNPFGEEPNAKAVHVVFGRDGAGPDGRAVGAAVEAARARGSRDEAAVVAGTLYLWTPDGLGRSQLAVELGRIPGGMRDGTARNWATVTSLLQMLED